MPAFLTKPANVLTITLVMVIVGILTYLGATTLVRPLPAATTSEVTATQLRQALSLAGLSAKPLAAAGLGQEQVTAVVSNARGYLTDHGAAFTAAVGDYRDASLLVQKLERRVKTGQASSENLSALTAARTALTSAASAKESAINAVFSASTADLPGPAVQALTNIRANRGRSAPTEFLVTSRSESDWMNLRDALANDRISARLGESPDSDRHQTLLDANAEAAVTAAKSSLGNLAAVDTAWKSAVGG